MNADERLEEIFRTAMEKRDASPLGPIDTRLHKHLIIELAAVVVNLEAKVMALELRLGFDEHHWLDVTWPERLPNYEVARALWPHNRRPRPSVRMINGLHGRGVRSWRDVLPLHPAELLRWRQVGVGSVGLLSRAFRAVDIQWPAE